jgi:autotransporter-associated beta strand protein
LEIARNEALTHFFQYKRKLTCVQLHLHRSQHPLKTYTPENVFTESNPTQIQPMKPKFKRFALAASVPLVFATYTQAQTFNTANDAGNWGTASNWTPATVPNAIDAEAIVNGAGPSGTAPATLALDVLLDGNYTIGKLTRSVTGGQAATFPTTPTSNDPTKGLTLEKTTGTPEINILGDVFFYSAIFGNQGFEKTGAGRFTFRFNSIDQIYTGPIKISGGTLGINKDRSLGDVNNDIEITPTADVDSTLFAEPGNNTDAITLPATRTITLNDLNNADAFDPCLSANAAAVVFTIDGDIGEVASSGSYLKKTGPGVVVLNGTNTWTGGTIVSAGVLSATKPEAFPSYDSQFIQVSGTSTLAVRYGDASTWTDTQIGNLLSNASLTINSTASFGIDTTGNALAATFAGDIPVSNFSKIGAGTLILSDPQTTIGGVSLFGGTLQLDPASSLPVGLVFKNIVSGTTLDLGGTSASVSDLQEVSGGTTTITNGSLTYTGGSLTLSGNNGTLTDLLGLTEFTYATSGSELKIENANNVNGSVNTALFAAGTNTITASSRVLVGGGASANTGPHINTLRLGTTNTINSTSLQLGAFNSAGVVNFQTGLTAPSLKLRGTDGTSAMTLLRVGDTTSGSRSGAGTLDLTRGTADILATNILVGRHGANSNNGDTSIMTIPDGTVTATTLTLALKQGSGDPLIIANVNQSGGTVSLEDLVMVETLDAAAPNVASSTQNLRANYNLSGGTLIVGEVKPGNLVTPITAGTTQRNLILIGGTLVNKASSDLSISGVSVVVSGVSSTVLDSTPGQKVVLASDATYSARMNSANETSGKLTVDGELDLTAAPTFVILDDAATAELVPNGNKLVLIDYLNGSLAGTFTGLPDGAAVVVIKGDVTNNFVIDYNDPDYGNKAVTLTSTNAAAGNNYASWAIDNDIEGEPFDGDFDNDGISNGVEYALGKNPTASDTPAGVLSGNTITFTKGADAVTNGDVDWIIETSTTLATDSWTPEAAVEVGNTIAYSFTLGTPPKKFARLKVVQVP